MPEPKPDFKPISRKAADATAIPAGHARDEQIKVNADANAERLDKAAETAGAINPAAFSPDREILAKTTEIAVSRPNFPHPVLDAQRRHAGVMHPWSGNAAVQHQRAQVAPVSLGFPQQDQTRRFQPGVYLLHRLRTWCGRFIDARVRNNGEKFMNTRPGNRPGLAALHLFTDSAAGDIMPCGIFPMSIHQQVGINGYHPPRPSYAAFLLGPDSECRALHTQHSESGPRRTRIEVHRP